MRVKRIIALGLAVVTLAINLVSVTYAASDYYRDTLGTNYALGSPLASDDFSADDWDKWEMAIFGMFIGNYVKIGKESYMDAFKSGSDGLKAMQFAAGGDVNSNGTLKKMLNICMTAQQSNYTALYTRYKYVEYGQVSRLDLGTRVAKFKDLFPVPVSSSLYGSTTDENENGNNKILIKDSAGMTEPIVWMTLKKTDALVPTKVHNSKVVYEDYYRYAMIVAAELPEISVSVGGEEKVLFSLLDGYDSQLMQMVLAKLEKNLGEKGFNTLYNENPDIVIDAFGNICALTAGKPVVIIPAAANKNINKEKEVNMLNSLIVNSLFGARNQTTMSALADSRFFQDTNALFPQKELSFGGTVAVSDKNAISDRVAIMYNDTDPLLNKTLYAELSNNDTYKTNFKEFEETCGFPLLQDDSSTSTSGTGNTGGTNTATGGTNTATGGTVAGAGIQNNNGSNFVERTVSGLAITHPNGTGFMGFDIEKQTLGKNINDVIDANSLYRAPIKFEMTGTNISAFDFAWGISVWMGNDAVRTKDAIGAMNIALSGIGNVFPYVLNDSSLSTMLMVNGGSSTNKTDLFSGHYYITPSMTSFNSTTWVFGVDQNIFSKDFYDFALRNVDGSVSGNVADASEMRSLLSGLKDPYEIYSLLSSNSSSDARAQIQKNKTDQIYVGGLIKTFAGTRFNISQEDNEKITNTVDMKLEDFAKYLDEPISNVSKLYGKTTPNGKYYASAVSFRVCKVYQPSAVFEAVGQIYDLDSGAAFSQYTTNLYITYLDWYGILDNKSDEDLRIDTEFFAGRDYLNIDPDDLLDTMTEEEKRKVITNNTYKFLDASESGRQYRAEMASNIITDLLDKWYNSVAGSTEHNGFLNVSGYKDNVLTSFILDNWELLSGIYFGVMFIAVISLAVISKRGLTWLLATEASVLLAVGAVPGYVEMVPFICNNIIQDVFQDNAVFWLASEEVKNAAQREDIDTGTLVNSSMSDDEIRETVVLMNSIRLQKSDKTMLVKLDTSKKVIEQVSVGWDKLQQKASTRWLVPNLIQQMSADKDNYDYVYITTYDWLSNMTRGYLAVLPYNDSITAGMTLQAAYNKLADSFATGELAETDTSGADKKYSVNQDGAMSFNLRDAASKKNVFGIYKETNDIGATAENSYRSITRLDTDTIDDVHTRIYFMAVEALKFNSNLETLADPNPGVQKADWDAFADNPQSALGPSFKSAFTAYNDNLLERLNVYNRYEPEDGRIDMRFANLWMTEGPGLYFYALVKDTLPITSNSVQTIATNLLGGYAEEVDATTSQPTGERVRTSFMHQGETGYVRDFLDLEELFTNVLPYMYAEQLAAGGNGAEGTANTGLSGDVELGDKYEIYKDNKNFWLYRSNWVTKLITDKQYSKSADIYYIDGSGARVKSTCYTMIDPRSYVGRDMVFSRAQMESMGLSERDLNLLEIKLVNLNDKVCDEWTKLVNYANITDMSPEIMERLMTVVAVTEFSKEITRVNPLNSTMSLYPRSLDLRNITWDQLLRHMIVSSTHNSSYLTSNTLIRTIAGSCGMFMAFLTCFISSMNNSWIPFARDVLLSIMLYLVLICIGANLLKGYKQKFKAAGGWLCTYLLFGVFTGLFYFAIANMVGSGQSAEVLADGVTVELTTTSLSFKLLAVLILDVLYGFGIFKYMKDVVFRGGIAGLMSYIKDGGFSFFYDVASNVSNGIHNGISKLRGDVNRTGAGLLSFGSKNAQKIENKEENGKTKPIKVEGNVVNKSKSGAEANGLQSTIDDASWVMDAVDREKKSQIESHRRNIEDRINQGKEQMKQAEGDNKPSKK